MTERKPSGVSFENWIEHQIRRGQEAGAFDNLAGAGKPLPGIDRPRGELDWVVNYARRENLDVLPMLPPSLALARELEDLPEKVAREHSEKRVREDRRGLECAHPRGASAPAGRAAAANHAGGCGPGGLSLARQPRSATLIRMVGPGDT